MSASTQWDVGRSQRRCTGTGNELKEGDIYYSALREQGDSFVREDYSTNAWNEIDTNHFFSFWRTRVPTQEEQKQKKLVVDIEAFYTFFRNLEKEEAPQRRLFRYLIALLLVRKRVLRLDEIERHDDGETLQLYDNREKTACQVFAPPATPEHLAQAQEELNQIFDCQTDA